MGRSKHPEMTSDGKYRGVVYGRILKSTGETYVGETANETIRKQCWKKLKPKGYGGAKITQARAKYGVGPGEWDYVIFEEIIKDTQEELENALMDRQRFWIKEKDSINYGFNETPGNGMEGMTQTAESRELISKNHRNYQSDAAKQKISAAMKGRTHTPESRAKISAANKGKKRTAAQNQAQSIRMKGKNPAAATEGAKKWVIDNGGGYWKNHALSAQAKANMKAAQQKKGTKTIATFPDGHEKTFNTMLDAAKSCGVNVGSVASAIKTGGKTRNGYKFKKI